MPIFIVLSLAAALLTACDNSDPKAQLKGQSNTSFTFYGKAVDQDGQPLGNVEFIFRVESIPRDWTFDSRGQPHNYQTRSTVSGSDGNFKIDLTAHAIRIDPTTPTGYRHLHNIYGQGDSGVYNLGYTINAWGEVWYKSNPENPAVYVFVKDGIHEVSALPCRGGDQEQGGKSVANEAGWPPQPSLPDVVYKPPTTRPATLPK